MTQSGGLGLAALALLAGSSLGISGFVSVGNTADLTPNDLLLYWDEDPGTCEAAGLLVPEPSGNTQAALRAGLPPQASVKNPVDVMASATAEQYGQALRLLGAAEEIDAIIAVDIPAFVAAEDVAREITAAAGAQPAKPIIAVSLTADPAPASPSNARIPTFTYPEEAAAALGQIARWAEWRAGPPTTS